MPLRPLWAFIACWRVKFVLIFYYTILLLRFLHLLLLVPLLFFLLFSSLFEELICLPLLVWIMYICIAKVQVCYIWLRYVFWSLHFAKRRTYSLSTAPQEMFKVFWDWLHNGKCGRLYLCHLKKQLTFLHMEFQGVSILWKLPSCVIVFDMWLLWNVEMDAHISRVYAPHLEEHIAM
jgi:hypothetical protein